MEGRVVLDKYRVGALLGRGSMGEVYRARPLVGGPDVVVKFMGTRFAGQPRFREMFGQEMALMARFRHPQAVRLLEGSLDDPAGPCLVMEFVAGAELGHVLHVAGRLDAERLAGIVLPLCQALHAAHTAGIIHRDLKPANIMVTDVGTPAESAKVMDLGLASLAFKPHIPVEKLLGNTEVRAVGTPAYMCPEQIRGDDTDSRGDIYSLGVILYEALTGALPFEHSHVLALLEAHARQRPPDFAGRGIDTVPAAVEAVVMRCLEKFPNERPQTAYQVAHQFLAALGHKKAPDPAGFSPAEVDEPTCGGSRTFNSTTDQIANALEAWMPEAVAVIKLRGFLEDLGARVVESAPGLIRVRLGEPPPPPEPPKGLWKLFHRPPPPPAEPPIDPVAIDLHLTKKPGRGTRLDVAAVFRALDGPLPADPRWHRRTKKVFADLKAYLMEQR
jgi:serine/threonine protein kinase